MRGDLDTLTVTTAPTTGDLTDLSTVRRELQIAAGDTTNDAWLTDAVRQYSDAIASFCRRPEGFGRASLVQTWRLGSSAPCLVLSRDIAPTVSALTEDGAALTSVDWLLDGSILYRLADDALIPWTASKVTVTYQAGFALPTDAPHDLRRCAIDLVVRAWNARGRDPALRSERVLDVIATSWDTPGGPGYRGGLPIDIADRIGPWARQVLA
jgi:hypothetical protein